MCVRESVYLYVYVYVYVYERGLDIEVLSHIKATQGPPLATVSLYD